METDSKRTARIEASWLKVLGDEFDKPYMQQLRAFLLKEKKSGQAVFPPGPLIFNAFQQTPFPRVRVVILGQDPYHGPGQAHGLSFSVPRGVVPPPSLVNIYKEIEMSLGITRPQQGDLTSWSQQGVLLLNTTLTVRAGTPKSHAGQGWETFTDRVITLLNQDREALVFVLWGRHAGTKKSLIDPARHLVLTAAHPSPLSAHSGFFGCGHFLKINQHLREVPASVLAFTIFSSSSKKVLDFSPVID